MGADVTTETPRPRETSRHGSFLAGDMVRTWAGQMKHKYHDKDAVVVSVQNSRVMVGILPRGETMNEGKVFMKQNVKMIHPVKTTRDSSAAK
eukprot:12169535-Prorocentrum_lima.AAC.1